MVIPETTPASLHTIERLATWVFLDMGFLVGLTIFIEVAYFLKLRLALHARKPDPSLENDCCCRRLPTAR